MVRSQDPIFRGVYTQHFLRDQVHFGRARIEAARHLPRLRFCFALLFLTLFNTLLHRLGPELCKGLLGVKQTQGGGQRGNEPLKAPPVGWKWAKSRENSPEMGLVPHCGPALSIFGCFHPFSVSPPGSRQS